MGQDGPVGDVESRPAVGPGESAHARKVTLKDVAAEAGVHVSTVSRALDADKRDLVSGTTRDRIERVAQRLGFRPDRLAGSLRRGRTNVIGVVVADLENPYFGPVLRGIENALGGRDVLPIVVETRDSSERLERVCETLIDHRVDAIVAAAGRERDLETMRGIAGQVPLVLVVRALDDLAVPTLAHDDVLGGGLAAEHLIGLGHTRLAQLVGPVDISSFGDRRNGFRDAVRRAGLSALDVSDEATRLPTIAEGRRLMELLLAEHRDDLPTGLFVHNDTMAVGALDAARAAGLRCPEDVSIIGYNNIPLTGHLDPPLTTIHLPGYELGRMAADTVLEMLAEPAVTPRRLTLPPRLVVRGSTAAPPQR